VSETNELLSSYFIRGFLEGAKRQGHDIMFILKEADIDPMKVEDPDALMDGKQLQSLFDALMQQLDDIYLGFVKERHKPILNLATLKMAMDAETLGESIRARTQFRESLRDDVHYEFRLDKKQHEFSLTVDDFEMVQGVDAHLFYWLRLSTIYRYHSWLIGRRIKLNRVHFSSPEPAFGPAHLLLFNCDIAFNQPQTVALAWPTADFSSMPPDSAIESAHKKELDEAEDRDALYAELMKQYQTFGGPYPAAGTMNIDDVVAPAETRDRLIQALETSMARRTQPASPTMRAGVMP